MQSSSALFGTFSPLTPAYWADARAQLKNVRMLTLAGIITAASIVLESFPIYLLGTSLKIYFSFLVISLGCYVYGPAVGILVGFANDTLGFLISSFGEPYFPGYLITAMLSGLIYGTLLYRQRITVLRRTAVQAQTNAAAHYCGAAYYQLRQQRAVGQRVEGHALRQGLLLLLHHRPYQKHHHAAH